MYLIWILYCWDAFALFWVINMFFNKRTVERETMRSRWRYMFLFILSFYLLFGGWNSPRLFPSPHSSVLGLISFIIVLLGLCLAIWARLVLGGNWSGTITFKENHELIVRGPYAFVRHPIYTAMLMMALGLAVVLAKLGSFLGLALMFLSFWIKFRQEEKLMIGHFGDRYIDYMKRVRAIIPFVL